MVFWFWVLVTVLLVPLVAYGLMMAALCLGCRYLGIDPRRVLEARGERRPNKRSMWWGLW